MGLLKWAEFLVMSPDWCTYERRWFVVIDGSDIDGCGKILAVSQSATAWSICNCRAAIMKPRNNKSQYSLGTDLGKFFLVTGKQMIEHPGPHLTIFPATQSMHRQCWTSQGCPNTRWVWLVSTKKTGSSQHDQIHWWRLLGDCVNSPFKAIPGNTVGKGFGTAFFYLNPFCPSLPVCALSAGSPIWAWSLQGAATVTCWGSGPGFLEMSKRRFW